MELDGKLSEGMDGSHEDGFFRRLKDGASIVILSVLIWVANSVQQSNREIAILQTTVENLKQEISQGLANSYTSHDAEKDLRLRDQEISEIKNRVSILENVYRTKSILIPH